MCISICVYLYTYTYRYIDIHRNIHVHVHVRTYIYTYIYIIYQIYTVNIYTHTLYTYTYVLAGSPSFTREVARELQRGHRFFHDAVSLVSLQRVDEAGIVPKIASSGAVRFGKKNRTGRRREREGGREDTIFLAMGRLPGENVGGVL